MTTPPGETHSSAFREAHLRDYWKIVWHARWTVLAIFLLVVTLTAVWTFLQPRIYRATATIEIQSQARNLAAGQDVSGLGATGLGWLAEEKYHNTQVEVLRSRAVAKRVVENLSLASDPMFEAASDPVDAFRRSIIVEPRRETGLIEISIAGTDPDRITHWVNEVAEAYVRRNFEVAQANAQTAIDMMETEIEKWEVVLSESEKRRIQVLESSGLYDKDNQEEIVRQKLKTWNSELTEVQIEKNRLGGSLRQILQFSAAGDEMMKVPELAKDDTLKELIRSRFELERRLASAKVDLLPSHPVYERAASELAKNEQRVQERVGQILASLQNEYDKVVSHEQYLLTQIDAAEGASLSVVQASSDYEIINTNTESRKRVFDLMSKAMNEVNVGLQLMTNNVSILDKAVAPRIPISPRRKLNVILGAIFGLCLGIAIAFFLDYLDNTFRTPEDIEKYLGLSVLGVIPKIDENGDAARAIKEAYQSLRTSVIFSSKNRTRKVILVTSTSPQEGKSSTVANLGRALAQAGERTIILDCDLRRPTQHLHHQSERNIGLTNYLALEAGETDWRPFIRPSDAERLDLMPCGPIPPSPSELLGSERFKQLLTTLRESYEWILIDSPPASSLADSTLLAAEADMVIVVVQHNKTDRDLVRKSLQRLRSVDPFVAGAILNNVDISRAYDKDYYYASYYYYTEEEGKGKGKKKRKGKGDLESERNVG